MALSVRARVARGSLHPPIVLIHGAANSAKVWTFWQTELVRRGWSSFAIDLRGHGESEPSDLAATGMRDYLDDVLSVLRQLREPCVLVGWSMGGLVALMAADGADALPCIVLAPSSPARVIDCSVKVRTGTFGPEEYGILNRDPDRQPTMPDLDREERIVALDALARESRYARDERHRGILITDFRAPCLLLTGTADTAWPRAKYTDLPFKVDFMEISGASHWGLVLNRRVLSRAVPAVLRWVEERTSAMTSTKK